MSNDRPQSVGPPSSLSLIFAFEVDFIMGACNSTQAADNMEDHSQLQPKVNDKAKQPSGASFVTLRDCSLFVDDIPFRFASLNAPELLDGDVNGPFEWKDTFESLSMSGSFGRSVTRTYTLRIKSPRIGRGHINGWSQEWADWMWDSGRLEELDGVLDAAARANVRLIVPIINQDTGDDSNWVGSTVDLIMMRKGISSPRKARKIDWWTDHEMIESYKLIIDKLLNRINSKNGRRYGDDPVVLAWETGNEMNHLGYRPAPFSWTLTVAKHLKARAPRTLVMDGSFARTKNVEACFPKEVLECRDVDLISYHYYGNSESYRVAKDIALARRYGKAFIAGEYGFFSGAANVASFLSVVDKAGGAGSLIWSLRPHSSRGGFKTHGEDRGHWSYHLPGWSQPEHAEFDPRAADIVAKIRKASFVINREPVPSFPTPQPPSNINITEGLLHFRGAAWAEHYEVEVTEPESGAIHVHRPVHDSTKEGCLGVRLPFALSGGAPGALSIRMRGVSVDGRAGQWSEVVRVA